MPWLETELKLAVLASFISCQIEQEAGMHPGGRLHAIATSSLLRLTCACGVECTLAYKEEAMAAYWGLHCLTDQYAAAPGAIRQGRLITLHLPYFPSTLATPERRDMLQLMRKAETYGNPRLMNSTKRRPQKKSIGARPENVSRETTEEM